jgi:hypothetical protein
MIMVAGIFPVAIEQTQVNAAESTGVAVGRDALRYIQSVTSGYTAQAGPTAPIAAGSTLPLLPCTFGALATAPGVNPVMPLPNEALPAAAPTYADSSLLPIANFANPAAVALGGNQTLTGDKRFGWIGFYRRDTLSVSIAGAPQNVPAPYAQVWIITAQSTSEGQPPFSSANAALSTNIIAGVSLANTSTNGGVINFPMVGGVQTAQMAVPNAFVLVLSCPGDPALVGQILRLGTQLPNPTASAGTFWSLVPGSDLNPNDTNLPATTYTAGTLTPTPTAVATVFILGSPPDPHNVGQYLGPAQDITAVTGFVRVSN